MEGESEENSDDRGREEISLYTPPYIFSPITPIIRNHNKLSSSLIIIVFDHNFTLL